MANHIASAEPRETVYQMPAEHRRAILSQAQTDLTLISDHTRSMREIEQQRQQFIQMHGDAFGLDAGA